MGWSKVIALLHCWNLSLDIGIHFKINMGRGPEGERGEGRKRKPSARVVEKKSPAVESHSRSRRKVLRAPVLS